MKAAGVLIGAALMSALLTGTANAGPPSSINVDERANGHTITLHQGQSLHVVLYSTYWTIDGGHNRSVRVKSDQQYFSDTHSPGCRPGQGCGQVNRNFVAVTPGLATVTASRTTCGEALRCSPDKSSWKVTVRVVP